MEQSLKQKNKKGSPFSIFFIYAFFTCFIYVLPYFKYVVPYMIAAPIMLVSILIFFFGKKDWFNFAFLLCFLSVIVVFTSALFGKWPLVQAANEAVRNIRFFIPALWGVYALKYTSKKQQALFLILFAALTIYIFISSTIAFEEWPGIARELAKGNAEENPEVLSYTLRNVGGFEFSYMMGIITLCVAWLCFKAKNIFLKILFAVLVILCFDFIIKTMYTTLLILTFLGLCLLMFFNIKSPVYRFLLLFLALVLIVFTPSVTKYLSEAFSEFPALTEKFENIHIALTTKDVDAVGSRPERLAEAFSLWLEYPIFGSAHAGTEGHSMILGTLSEYGLVGFLSYAFLFSAGWKMILKELKEKSLSPILFNISMVFLLVLSFLNPTGYVFEITIAVFLVVPITTSLSITGSLSITPSKKEN